MLVSIFSLFWFLIIHKDLHRFFKIIIEKTTFEEFEEICEEIQRKKEIQFNYENEIIDFSIDLWTNFF